MKKQNVYIHQLQTLASKNLLPLAAGLITAYQMKDLLVSKSFNFELKILRTEPLKTVESYDQPAILGFSTYSWNFRQSLEVARLAKIRFPAALTIFGGPMIGLSQKPKELEKFFNLWPQVDIVVHGMGEWVFTEILLEYLNNKYFANIPGISYRDINSSKGFQSNLPAIFNRDINEIPSPFLEGVFDDILKTDRDKITGALWETNRGCPFKCSFCVQGDDIFNKV